MLTIATGYRGGTTFTDQFSNNVTIGRNYAGSEPEQLLIDGGFRRGTDIFKALALGATAVGIGRPYCFGLGAFGQAGVERVLDLLTRELLIALRGSGTININTIGPDYVHDLGRRV